MLTFLFAFKKNLYDLPLRGEKFKIKSNFLPFILLIVETELSDTINSSIKSIIDIKFLEIDDIIKVNLVWGKSSFNFLLQEVSK